MKYHELLNDFMIVGWLFTQLFHILSASQKKVNYLTDFKYLILQHTRHGCILNCTVSSGTLKTLTLFHINETTTN